MAEQRPSAEELKRRKVRKGTHSCWECRRRKIRCQYAAGDDVVCLPCQARGSVCRSQEFIDESRPQPQPDRRMAQRLGRLEDMMAKLVERIMPDGHDGHGTEHRGQPRGVSPTPSDSDDEGMQQTLDGLEASVVDDTPVGLLLGLRNMSAGAGSPPDALTPESAQTNATQPRPNPAKYEKVCRTLHALFPCQSDIDVMVGGTHAGFFIMAQFFTFRQVLQGKAEPVDSYRIIPPVAAHPSVLARRLLALCICMQQLPPNFDLRILQIKASLARTMTNIITVVHDLVTSNDDLVATAEGLQCLVLQGLWHSNAGNLRKAWLNYRRALSFGQLIGIDRGNYQALRYVDTAVKDKPAPEHLWYRIVACDRSLSMLLGLPAGSTDNSFASDEAMRRDTQMERLEKLHTVAAAKLIDRNSNKTSQAYALTQIIDRDLEAAARSMGTDWWDEPVVRPMGDDAATMGEFMHILLQIRHYDLLLLLHLPFMLRDATENQYDYSKATCSRASREVLKRYISFRNLVSAAYSCRHVDYSGLIAAMTLLLSYLRHNPAHPTISCPQRAEDRKLVEVVRERMQHVAVLNRDKLSQESADIIEQMMPILDAVDASMMGNVSECGTTALKCFQLNIPYLGTVNIHPSMGGEKLVIPVEENGVHPAALNVYMNALRTPTSQHSNERHSPADGGVALPETMDFGSLDTSLSAQALNGMLMELEPQNQTEMFNFPGLTAEAEDWTFQGVDTTYWSLLNNGNFQGTP